MLRSLASCLRGLWLLRDPALRRHLGEIAARERVLAGIRELHTGAKVESNILVVGYRPELLTMAPGAAVCAGTVLAFGDDVNGFGSINIGTRSWIGQYNNLRASGEASIHIGVGCLVSQFCSLVGSNHSIVRGQSILEQGPDHRRLGVVLEDDVWLGAGVTVLPGGRVGRGAVIGANSVVVGSVPANEIWVGSPARRIGERR